MVDRRVCGEGVMRIICLLVGVSSNVFNRLFWAAKVKVWA